MESHMHWADYLIFVGFLVISLSIGVYHSLTGGRQKTTNEFIMGNRRLSVIPTAISLLVSFYSAITTLGMTAEMYGYGIQYLIFHTFSTSLGIVIVERFIVPWIYPLKLVSIYDYLGRRYMSDSVRIFSASMGILSTVLFMGVAMYAPSAALEYATGLPLCVSIPLMAVLSITYAALGGIRAVIWTDVFQFVTLIAGITAIIVRGLIIVGGFENVFRLSGEEGRLVWANFSFDLRERHTVWAFLIATTMSSIRLNGFVQASVQRYSAVDRLSKARLTLLLNIPANFAMAAMSCVTGLIVLAYFSSVKCDPLANKDISNPNMLLPYFVTQIFEDSPGFAGLFLSTLYGGALSSMSSSLSGVAANCWEDILKWKLNHLPESWKVLINKFLVVLFGALSIAVAFFSASIPGPVTQVMVAMVNSVSGPMLAFFILGGVTRFVHWKGILLGGIVGVSFTFWLCIGSLTVRYNNTLPPVSVERCSRENGNLTFTSSSSLNFTNYSSFEVFDGIATTKDIWNQETEVLPTDRGQVNQLRGLENFYGISYLWVVPFGAIVTGFIALIASLATRDKDLEAKVDERLLLRFRGCGWEEKNERKEHLNKEDEVSFRQTPKIDATDQCSALKRPEDESL